MSDLPIIKLFSDNPDVWRILLDVVLIAAAAGYLLTYLIAFVRRPKDLERHSPPAGLSKPDRLLDELADAIIGVDNQDQILRVNKRTEELFGYTEQELSKRNYQSLLILPDGFKEDETCPIIIGGRMIGLEHDAFGLCKDGSRFPAKVTVTTSLSDPLKGLVAVRKVKAPPSVERLALEPPEDQLLEAAIRIRRFAKLIGHTSQLQLVEQELLLALKESAEEIYAHLNFSSQLASIQSGKIALDPQPLVIGPWLAEIVENSKRMAVGNSTNINLPPLAKSSLSIMTDKIVLGNILQTLLDFVLVTYQSPSLTIHMMNENVIEEARLPNPWNTGKLVGKGANDRRFGLILIAGPSPVEPTAGDEDKLAQRIAADPHIRLAKELARLINGELKVDANAYSGLLFQFYMIYQSCGPQEPSVLNEPQSKDVNDPVDSTDSFEGRVLSVTSDSNLRTWVREILQGEGFQVEECQPQQAISKIRGGELIDLVVLQPEFSDEPDFDLTYEMRQLRKPEELPILLVRRRDVDKSRISYYNAQDTVDFPDTGNKLAEKVIALYEKRSGGSNKAGQV